MKLLKALIVMFLVLLMYGVNVFAAPVPIDNASFEDATGWMTNGITNWDVNGSAGTITNLLNSFSGVPDGERVAWITEGSISQDLEWFVNPGNTLTFEVDVGTRWNMIDSSAFAIEILAGENHLASTVINGGSISPGEFETASLSYVIGDDDPLIGQQLSIVLANIGGRQLFFDNIHFDNDLTTDSGEVVPVPPVPGTGAPVPEPSTMLLLGVGLLGFAGNRKRRKK